MRIFQRNDFDNSDQELYSFFVFSKIRSLFYAGIASIRESATIVAAAMHPDSAQPSNKAFESFRKNLFPEVSALMKDMMVRAKKMFESDSWKKGIALRKKIPTRLRYADMPKGLEVMGKFVTNTKGEKKRRKKSLRKRKKRL